MKRFGWINLVLIAILFIAFGVRVYQIGSISNQFHVTRQFYTAQMVRGDYFAVADVPEWRHHVALLNQPPPLEPPVIQTVALLGYKLIGSEQLWIPRTFSALVWVIAAVFLFLGAKKIMRPEAALVAVAFYLFTPYAITSSRSFQANPTMIALTVITYFAILHYFETPTRKRLALAIIVAAAANLDMIYAVFTISLLFGWLSIQRHGFWGALKHPDTWLFAFFSLLPSGIYYFNGFFIAGFMRSQSGALFNAHLWFTPDYWVDWIGRIGVVVGYIPVIFSIQALLTARKPTQSATLRSLWLGYFIYGFLINWPITSHDYYSMPLIPIVALSLGSVVDFIVVRLKSPRQRQWIPAFALIVVGFISFSGLNTYLPTTTITPALARQLEMSEEIGAKVQHSTNTIFLAKDYGSLLKFYGEIAGYSWPSAWDYYAALVANRASENVAQRMKDSPNAQYFIVTDFDEYERQKDLRTYLETHFPIYEQASDYLIFDLTKPLPVQS